MCHVLQGKFVSDIASRSNEEQQTAYTYLLYRVDVPVPVAGTKGQTRTPEVGAPAPHVQTGRPWGVLVVLQVLDSELS